MAYTVRTIDDIFQELLQEKSTLATLDGLTDNGITDVNDLLTQLDNTKVSEHLKWLFNTALSIHLMEIRINSAIDDIDKIFETKRVGTAKWYVDKALEFQYPDALIVDPITYQVKYGSVDEAKQIIGSATISNIGNRNYIKVRRKDTNILSNDELNAFQGYINKLKDLGERITVLNLEGDLLTLNLDIKYDATISLNVIKADVEDTINSYLMNLEFDSRFITNSLIDKLQKIKGVIDPRFNGGVALDSLENEIEFTHEYITASGWAKINTATPLSDTINYFA